MNNCEMCENVYSFHCIPFKLVQIENVCFSSDLIFNVRNVYVHICNICKHLYTYMYV